MIKIKKATGNVGNVQKNVSDTSPALATVAPSETALSESSQTFVITFVIIGAGWYGVHIALELKKKYPRCKIILLEKNSDIFSEISGMFGIRLHNGLHYPRSDATRKTCRKGLEKFQKYYPELIRPHLYAIYGLGELDADEHPSKTNKEAFAAVCEELESCSEIQPAAWEYKRLLFAVDTKESSLPLGAPLRDYFSSALNDAGVTVLCNFEVTNIEKQCNGQFVVSGRRGEMPEEKFFFSHVINATSYQAFLPGPEKCLPLEMEIVYQPCLALMYDCTERPLSNLLFSFIVMDGWFPCLMPYDDRKDVKTEASSKYILTHGKWTIMGSFQTAEEAKNRLSTVNDEFISQKVKPNCEEEMEKFWPEFQKKFKYIKWIGAVLAKIKTEREFRSAVTFQNKENGMIYIIPGKVSNIFDAGEEVLALVDLEQKEIIKDGHYCYVKGGTLDTAQREIFEKPDDNSRSTCRLQTYEKSEFRQPGGQPGEANSPNFWNASVLEQTNSVQTQGMSVSR
jgi:FAD dependent oxidoreductase